MAYDERLAERIRGALSGWKAVSERRMFGGIAFLLHGNMCCGVIRDLLVLRLGSPGAECALRRPHTREMDFTGRPMKGMVYVEPEGTLSSTELQEWLEQAVQFAQALPRKTMPAKTRRAASARRSSTGPRGTR
jgi:TfoX/Sxy family transcriptional regulator of competence genes